MDLDFQQGFKTIILNMEMAGRDYAEKRAKSWQAQELKYAVLSEEMKKLDKNMAFNLKESLAKASAGYRQYLKETSQSIKEENIAKVIYEKHRAEFEALRSLTSLEKSTRQSIGV